MTGMLETWERVDDVVREDAADDLREGLQPLPLLIAGDRRQPLMLVRLHPFEGLDEAMVDGIIAIAAVEPQRALLVAACGLRHDEDGLPRQGLVLVEARRERGRTTVRERLMPYELERGSVEWREPLTAEGGRGHTVYAGVLKHALHPRHRPISQGQRMGRIGRALMQGHLVALSPEAEVRFGVRPVGVDG